jgi:hypothetical protein
MSTQERDIVHSDIRPENPPERAAHYLDVPNMPWEATKFPGIKIKVLYTDDTGITTALFKLEPGAIVPLHEHTALEQTYVIEGSLRTTKANVDLANSSGVPPAISTRRLPPMARCCLAFFSSPIVLLTAKGFLPPQGSGRAISHQRAVRRGPCQWRPCARAATGIHFLRSAVWTSVRF